MTASSDHRQLADAFVAASGASVIERVEIDPRPARLAPPPERYRTAPVSTWLRAFLGGGQEVYRHQALALRSLERDHVVLSTATASGKSLVFMAPAIAELLTGPGRILVFYPQKALIGDQLSRWQGELRRAGLAPDLVGELTGDVPVPTRDKVLERARVIVATPDVFHAWLMPMAGAASVEAFLRDLCLVAIDEAHALEGVFGTHFSFFFRRFRAARDRALARRGLPAGRDTLRVIATTATLRDPVGHLELLTGLPFVGIGEEDNGAPSQGTTVLHVEGPDRGAPGERTVADTIATIYQLMPTDAAVISFANSRQGVERIARMVARDDFVPYRQGYSADDRREIEDGLRNGRYRGTGATSALELGIDMRQFAYGINLGAPDNLKSLRQRVGRVGRTRAGLFIVIAPRAAFGALGTSLQNCMTGPVEPSPVYPGNRFIQFQQACCFLAEGGGPSAVRSDDGVEWPAGFADALDLAQPGTSRPRELDDLAATGLDHPHLAFSLRSMPTVTYALKHAQTGDLIGTIDHQKALREAYPGATYFHRRTAYRVTEWRSSSFEHVIRILPQRRGEPTYPLLRCQVAASLEADAIIDGNLLASEGGALFEAQLRVVESVEGYRLGRTALPYRDLRDRDPRLSRKQREYHTTGVVVQIDQGWFAGAAEQAATNRQLIAEALKTLLIHEFGVASTDIQVADNGIALHSAGGARKIENAVAVFDTVIGGLRLTAPVFREFGALLSQLDRGVALAGNEALVGGTIVAKLDRWYRTLTQKNPRDPLGAAARPGTHLVYAPGSWVTLTIHGQSVARQLLEPQLVTIGAGEQLMYRYDAGSGAQGWVAEEHVRAIGNEWQRAMWDPRTNTLEPVEVLS